MKQIFLSSVVAVVWCVAAPFAQQQRTPPATAAPAHNVFVLAGCLKAGADSTAPFKLTEASSIGQPIPGAVDPGAVGTSGEKGSYELLPVSGVDTQGIDADMLKAHVGQRLEVIVRPIESPPAAPAAGATAVQAAKPTERAAPRRFSVTEIKRVIGAC
jgi:hypothetical protein